MKIFIKLSCSSATIFFHLPLSVAGTSFARLRQVTALMPKNCCVADTHVCDLGIFHKCQFLTGRGHCSSCSVRIWKSRYPLGRRFLLWSWSLHRAPAFLCLWFWGDQSELLCFGTVLTYIQCLIIKDIWTPDHTRAMRCSWLLPFFHAWPEESILELGSITARVVRAGAETILYVRPV